MRRAQLVTLPKEERRRLRILAGARSTSPSVARRARIVLRASEGAPNNRIAAELRTSEGTVALWRRRFLLHGIPGISQDAPRSGRPPAIPPAKVREVLDATSRARSPGEPRWSTRRMAQSVGVSKSSVQRIWRSRGVDPHSRKVRSTPADGFGFFDRVTDMVGVYLHAPERAVAFCSDETGKPVALSAGEREGISRLRQRSRGAEFRAFLQVIDRETPPHLDLHLLVDSRLAPPPPEVERWLARHERVHLHFLPSDPVSATLIDRLVRGFSKPRSGTGNLPGAQRLRHSIRNYLRSPADGLRPFVWTASSLDIRGRSGRPAILEDTSGSLRPDRPA